MKGYEMPRLLLGFVLFLSVSGLYAENLKVPVGQQGDVQTPVPKHGETRQHVIKHFGQPQTAFPKIGRPPITRWDYSDFSVYFEYDRVISSVRHHTAPSSAAASSQGVSHDVDLRTPRGSW